MKKSMMVVAAVGLLALTGCSSKPNTWKEGEYFTQKENISLAGNVAAYAGYPYLISDNKYRDSYDTAMRSGTMGVLLPQSLNGMNPLAAGGLGVGLGLVGSLTKTAPLDHAIVVTAPINDAEKYNDSATIQRIMKENFKIRDIDEGYSVDVSELRNSMKMEQLVCQEYSGMINQWDFTHECYFPGWEKFRMNIRAVRPASGTEFPGVLNLKPGKYAVLVVRSEKGLSLLPRPDAAAPYFQLKHRVYVTGNTILPFVRPNKDGKRLAFIDGKATLL